MFLGTEGGFVIHSRLSFYATLFLLTGAVGCWQPGQSTYPVGALSPDAGLSRAKAATKSQANDGGNRQRSAAFIARLDHDGHPIWSVTTSGPGYVVAHAIALDGQGNTVMMGTFNGQVSFGRYGLRSVGIFGDYFLAKISKQGRPLWVRALLPADMKAPSGLAISKAGKIFVTGAFSGQRNLAGKALSAAGGRDIFVAAFAPDGQLLNAVRVGGPGDDVGHDIALGASGDIYLTGSFSGPSISMGGTTLKAGGAMNMFVARLKSTGHVRWARASRGCPRSEGYRLLLDNKGDVFVLGHFWGTELVLGQHRLEALSRKELTKDIFVTKLSANGAFRWAHALGGTAGDEGLGLSFDAYGDVSVLGRFQARSALFGQIIVHAPTAQGALFVATVSGQGIFLEANIGDAFFDQAEPNSAFSAEARFVTGDVYASAAHGVDLPAVTLWTAGLSSNQPHSHGN